MPFVLKKWIRRLRARFEGVGIFLARLLFTRCSRKRILSAARVMGDISFLWRPPPRIAAANLDIIFGRA